MENSTHVMRDASDNSLQDELDFSDPLRYFYPIESASFNRVARPTETVHLID